MSTAPTPQRPSPTTAAPPVDVVVVGAGIAGLVAARLAASTGVGQGGGRPRRVIVLDPRPIGGRARCDERDGFVLNRGPRALYVGGRADRVLRDLGVSLPGSAPDLRQARASLGGTLHRLPTGVGSFARTTLLSHRERLAVGRALTAASLSGPGASELSVREWLDRHGVAGRPRLLVEALVRLGTYADAPEELAAGPAFANVRRASTRGVRYLDGGFQAIVDQLAPTASAGIELRRTEAVRVETDTDGWVRVAGADGTEVIAASAIVAVATPSQARSLIGPEVGGTLREGISAGAACLELGLRRVPAIRFVLGIDEPTYLSVHAPPARLGPSGGAVVHLVRYGDVPADRSSSEVRAQLRSLGRAAGIDAEDVVVERFLPRMEVTAAIPRPSVDASLGRAPVKIDSMPGVHLAGDWVGSEGLLLDAACASAAEAARLAIERADTMVGP